LIVKLTVPVGLDADPHFSGLVFEDVRIADLLIDIERGADILQLLASDVLGLGIAVLVAQRLPDLAAFESPWQIFQVSASMWPSPDFGWRISASMISAT
jgi:hypothetical protein